jgi:hypothetical protein
MEFFILIISVPLFLIVVLLLSVFVLAKYPNREPAKASPAEMKASEANKDANNVGA